MFQQIRHDFGCGLAKRVRKHAGNADIGNGHTVLDAVFLRRFHTDQLETVSCEFPKLAEIFRRDKGTSHFHNWLIENHCYHVCMESTGKYWIPIFNYLENDIEICLTHPLVCA